MDALCSIEAWFEERGWHPFPFQRDVWRHYLAGESGLLHSATGTGKTLAAWLGPVAAGLADGPQRGVRVLWITPLRALAADTEASLVYPLSGLRSPWTVESRTGDTSATLRKRQNESLPAALVTTPESLCLLLTREDSQEVFSSLECVVVDEWHELMSTKRGVQTELCLARLRQFRPGIRTWGLSATLGNLEQSMRTLLGPGAKGVLVKGDLEKEIVIDSLLPDSAERFPWSGHFGTQMIPKVISAIDEGGTCLVFCNTRSQTEIWHQIILQTRPDWIGQIGLHHGSLDREERDQVEAGLKDGSLRAVVCTSSLDLGVDFTPVDRVLQVGSPKGVARLLQRAGRSGHRPGVASRVTCVPTHALEMVDIASAREAAIAGKIESRTGMERPLDVLAQHLVSIALGTGFSEEGMLAEIRTTAAYANISEEEWKWCLDFVTRGGFALRAYPEFKRVELVEGLYRVTDKDIAQRHRMSIGTIVSDVAMTVAYMGGSKLGTVEESFLSRLKKGDRFVFAGKILEFLQIRDTTAYVKKATSLKGAVPRWAGGRLPLSSELAHAIRDTLERVKHGELFSPELQCMAPLLQLQARWSAMPAADEFLVEKVESREGHHLFFYPLEGRLVHEGLAALFAHRIAKISPITFSIACNDYGFELLAPEEAPLAEALESGLLSTEDLGQDILDSLNSVEMAKRQFREIARVAGLVFQGYPGQQKKARQLQASSGLFYEVFARYDPDNMLLYQAQKEVLDRQLEQSRMRAALTRLQNASLLLTTPAKPTPFAFPILVDRLRETLTTESITEQIQKMAIKLDAEAGE